MTKLLYPELSYKIIGLLFDVHNKLGSGYQEKYYQKAMKLKLNKENLKFKEQLKVDLNFENTNIGRYFLDFLIENKIILELKVGNNFHRQDYKQIKAYLKSKNLELGILALFSNNSLQYKRILNKTK